jgi:hypothetical protein
VTEPRRFQSPTGRYTLTGEDVKAFSRQKTLPIDVQHKIQPLTRDERVIRARQAALYAEGIFQGYRAVSPMPAGEYTVPSHSDLGKSIMSQALDQAEQALMRHYSMPDRWGDLIRQYCPDLSPYPNKLRAKDDQVMHAGELLHWDTVLIMGRPTQLPCGCS